MVRSQDITRPDGISIADPIDVPREIRQYGSFIEWLFAKYPCIGRGRATEGYGALTKTLQQNETDGRANECADSAAEL